MNDESLPRKRGYVYTEQYNVRIEPDLKADIRFLDGEGVEVSELIRPLIRDAVTKAKKKLEDKKVS